MEEPLPCASVRIPIRRSAEHPTKDGLAYMPRPLRDLECGVRGREMVFVEVFENGWLGDAAFSRSYLWPGHVDSFSAVQAQQTKASVNLCLQMEPDLFEIPRRSL
jgi:hypothetical protein